MRLSMVGASLTAAPSVRIAKSRQSYMAKRTKQTELSLLVGEVIYLGIKCRTMNDVICRLTIGGMQRNKNSRNRHFWTETISVNILHRESVLTGANHILLTPIPDLNVCIIFINYISKRNFCINTSMGGKYPSPQLYRR